MEEFRVFLVFEFIDMDLRRYIDLLPDDTLMSKTEVVRLISFRSYAIFMMMSKMTSEFC